jgi:sugar phosphate isomerase/epimerase
MISRRNFIAAMGAGFAGLREAMGAGSRFQLGIGTFTYRGVSEDEMIDDLKGLKIKLIEVSHPPYHLPAVKLDAVRSLKAKLDRAEISAPSYFCRVIETESDLELAIQVARTLGAHHVSGVAMGDTLKMIDARFGREGLRFGIHNHWYRGRKFAYESADDLLNTLKGLSDTVGVTFDTGHMASCGHDPLEALTKLWDHVQLVHLKDVESVGDDKNTILGHGIAKTSAVVDLLKRRGYTGLAAIEYEAAPQNPQRDVARCVEFARSLMHA